MFRGLLHEHFAVTSTCLNSDEAGIRQFAAGRILLRAFSSFGGAALDVEQVVRQLENQTEAVSESVETLKQIRIGTIGAFALCRDDAELKTGPEERPGLVCVDALQLIQSAHVILAR